MGVVNTIENNRSNSKISLNLEGHTICPARLALPDGSACGWLEGDYNLLTT